MALEIYIEDVAIPYEDDLKVSLNYVNPLFSEKKINEVFSYSFSLPASPVLNNLLKNSKRVDAITRKFILNAKIKTHGCLLVQGKINISKTSNNYYSCNIYNDGRDVYNVTSDNSISSFDFGKLELWTEAEEATLTGTERIERWSEHFGEINDSDPNTGAYKFPMIKAYYDDPEKEEAKVKDDGLNYIFWKGGGVNIGFWQTAEPTLTGTGQKNTTVNTVDLPNGNYWVNTYSPCMRLEYMLEMIAKAFDLTIDKNDLADIQEFKRLTNFSSYVADEEASDGPSGPNSLNSHGGRYELSDFTPDTSGWEIFKTLTELFSAVFFIANNNTISILLSKNLLNGDAIDVTSKCNPETIINEGDGGKEISFYYDIDPEDLSIINDQAHGAWSHENINKWMYKGIGEQLKDGTVISSMPLRTLLAKPRNYSRVFDFYQIWEGYKSQCSGLHDNYYLSFAFMKPRGAWPIDDNYLDKGEQLMLSSRVFPEENSKPTRFNLLLFHGRAVSKGKITQINPDWTCELENPLTPFFDLGIYLTCNIETTADYNISGIDPDHPNITVSDKTIYLNDKPGVVKKGTYSNYHEDLSEFETATEEVTKTLYLQPYEIHEYSKFRNPKHRINAPEGNFEGIIKEFKVTISKQGISPTTVTYLKQLYNE